LVFVQAMTNGAYVARQYSAMVPLMNARPRRMAIGLALVVALIAALIQIWLIAGDWNLSDVDAYWDAAMRLRHGDALYPVGQDPDNYRVFRYAPWFAWLWVPLTWLPKEVAGLLWEVLVGGAAVAVYVGLVRVRSAAAIALGLVLAPWMLSLVQVGNIQPLVVAMLAFGVSRRSGPLWIGIVASLKAVPIAWALVYVARREWGRVVAAVAAATLLAATFLFVPLEGYVTNPGRSGLSLYYYASPQAWLLGALAAGLLALVLAWRRSAWVWPAIAIAVIAITPRSHITYATYLVIGLINGQRDRITSVETTHGD
jgi:hypothetical protein